VEPERPGLAFRPVEGPSAGETGSECSGHELAMAAPGSGAEKGRSRTGGGRGTFSVNGSSDDDDGDDGLPNDQLSAQLTSTAMAKSPAGSSAFLPLLGSAIMTENRRGSRIFPPFRVHLAAGRRTQSRMRARVSVSFARLPAITHAPVEFRLTPASAAEETEANSPSPAPLWLAAAVVESTVV